MKPRRNFDEVAAAWDENPGRLKVMGDIAETMFERIALTSDMDILDFGCGTGLLSLRMADRVSSLTGVDTSASMLDVFEQKARELELTNVQSMLVDIDQGGGLTGKYDLIVSSMVFHHIENIDMVLKQLHAVLKPSGMLCIADLDLDGGLFHEDPTGVFHEGFDRDLFSEELKSSGFADIAMSTAASIAKPAGGEIREFTVFLATGKC